MISTIEAWSGLGEGLMTYNDCVGCMLRNLNSRRLCQMRQFVTLKNSQGDFSCKFVGTEHLLRGLYGPQLAWWFTLLHPSQFKIFNSADFFEVGLSMKMEISVA